MVTEEAVRAAIAGVYDPELGVDILSLGLVERLQVEGTRVEIDLLPTSAACPLGGWLVEQTAREVRFRCPGADVEVQLLEGRPWSEERMSPSARRQLGWGP